MGVIELVALAFGLSMDAFAVSICKGTCYSKAEFKDMMRYGLWFGGFQALMPLIGFIFGRLFYNLIEKFDHWIAFGLLAFLGINMIIDVLKGEEDCKCACETDRSKERSFKMMFTLAIATSIDAMAAGLSLAMIVNVNIYLAIILVGVITFVMSASGVKIGSIFGGKFGKYAQAAGGVILMFLGLKILLSHIM